MIQVSPYIDRTAVLRDYGSSSRSCIIRIAIANAWLTLAPRAADWNPFIQSISGTLRVGERLIVSIKPPGSRVMTFRPVLLIVDPCRELRWQGRLFMPRIFDGQHFFRLSKVGGGTLFEHGEQFEGLLVGAMGSTWLE
ncbi:SRPBCC domain-containing protein [Parasphingorhabdus sp.]|uniref:SRPBCC domain-containing protein n=1 Tax=Parasphingorhabdus sp. TaxID=2709688 RepID=UPI002F92CA8C